MSRRVLGLFAKWPEAGTVKTRLGGSPEWGAAVARAFLLDTLTRLAAVEARRIIAHAPDDTGPAFAPLSAGRFDMEPQGMGDLGQRMSRFIARHLAAGAEAVVLVGADSPTLPISYIEDAFAHLQSTDLVLGPATDGGYYLIGCRRVLPIFEGITWSGPQVLSQTIDLLSDPQWTLKLLPPWYDVDTPESWAMLRGHILAQRRAAIDPGIPLTEQLLRPITSVAEPEA